MNFKNFFSHCRLEHRCKDNKDKACRPWVTAEAFVVTLSNVTEERTLWSMKTKYDEQKFNFEVISFAANPEEGVEGAKFEDFA